MTMHNRVSVARLLYNLSLKKEVENKDVKLYIQNYLHYIESYLKENNKDSISVLFNTEPKNYKKIPISAYAYIAAMTEKITKDNEITTPKWVYNRKYYLDNPWYPPEVEKYPRLKAVLKDVSPEPFKSRNLYVSEDALKVV